MCTQTESRAFFVFAFSRKLWTFLCFSDIYIGRISRTKEKRKKAQLSSCWFVHNQHRVKKIISKYIVLSGAWPIYLSRSDLAGPARNCIERGYLLPVTITIVHSYWLQTREGSMLTIYCPISPVLFFELDGGWNLVWDWEMKYFEKLLN